MTKLTFSEPISGQWPCQVEGRIVATNEPYHFRQRGQTASLRIFDKPLGESLDKHNRLINRVLRVLSKITGVQFKSAELPIELAKYSLEVEPLTCDAENCADEVLSTLLTLLAMHEQAIETEQASGRQQG